MLYSYLSVQSSKTARLPLPRKLIMWLRRSASHVFSFLFTRLLGYVYVWAWLLGWLIAPKDVCRYIRMLKDAPFHILQFALWMCDGFFEFCIFSITYVLSSFLYVLRRGNEQYMIIIVKNLWTEQISKNCCVYRMQVDDKIKVKTSCSKIYAAISWGH